MESEIKVDLIAGFRGAGKTTLLRRMTERLWQGQHTVLLINERGRTVPVQAQLPASCTVVEWQHGCLCCSANTLLTQSLSELTEKYRPERIVVELAETARITDTKAAFEAVGNTSFQIEHIIYVLNAESFVMKWELSAAFMARQLRDSPVVWLTHDENADQELRRQIAQVVSESNPSCRLMDSGGDIVELYRKSTLHKKIVFYPKTSEKSRANTVYWKT